MSKTLKAILVSIYCAVFLHSLKYLLFHRHEEIVELNYLMRTPGLMRKIFREIKKSRMNSTYITTDFNIPTRFKTDLKFILIWNHVLDHPSKIFKEGQRVFLDYNCSHYNCYITSNKGLLMDIRYFDVILFDEESHWEPRPAFRTLNQRYIFTASEPALYSICDPKFDSYYNLTWTYRLDSNIGSPPILILDNNGEVVGPKINMTWLSPMKATSEKVRNKISGKKKAIAWFVPNCIHKESVLQNIVNNLTATLARNKLSLDIYGWCGNLKCPKDRIEECLGLLRKNYYFYLAFEHALGKDYVTEDILYPLQNYAVPIVYGGADYTWFLPPGSYIDATKMEASEVVSMVITAMKNPEVYSNYFRWHNHYTYKSAPMDTGLCTLCGYLNNPLHNFSVVHQFRKWWNRNEEDCKHHLSRRVFN